VPPTSRSEPRQRRSASRKLPKLGGSRSGLRAGWRRAFTTDVGTPSVQPRPLVPRETRRWRGPCRGRASVERAFGRLKNECGLAPLRVRGTERVALHADLVMLVRLSQPTYPDRDQFRSWPKVVSSTTCPNSTSWIRVVSSGAASVIRSTTSI
jgi:hypothetical protein